MSGEAHADISAEVPPDAPNSLDVRNVLDVPTDLLGSLDISAPSNPFHDGIEKLTTEKFSTVFVEIAGLTFAFEEHDIELILNYASTEIDMNHDEPTWLVGSFSYDDNERPLYVVDSGEWFLGKKFSDLSVEGLNYLYIVKLKDVALGLACESYQEHQVLEKSSVHWRQRVGVRPWLSGIIQEDKCCVVQVNVLKHLMNQQL